MIIKICVLIAISLSLLFYSFQMHFCDWFVDNEKLRDQVQKQVKNKTIVELINNEFRGKLLKYLCAKGKGN